MNEICTDMQMFNIMKYINQYTSGKKLKITKKNQNQNQNQKTKLKNDKIYLLKSCIAIRMTTKSEDGLNKIESTKKNANRAH